MIGIAGVSRGLPKRPTLALVIACAVLAIGLTYTVVSSTLAAALAVLFAFIGAALILPLPTGLFVYFAYLGLNGWLKDVTDYYPLIHIGPDLITLALAARWALPRVLGRRGLVVGVPEGRPLLAFVLWSILLAFTPATSPLLAVGGFKAYIEPILFYVIAFDTLTSPRQLRPFMAVLLPIAIAMPAYAFVQVVQGPAAVAALGPGFAREVQQFPGYDISINSSRFTGFRPLSFGGDAGNASAIDFAMPFMMLAVALAPRDRRVGTDGFARIAALIAIPLCVGGIFLSGARIYETALAIGLVAMPFLDRSRVSVIAAVICIPLVLGGGALAARYTGGVAVARAATLSNPLETYLTDRGTVLRQIPDTMLHHPFGIGMGKAVAGSAAASSVLGIQVDFVATENFFLVMLDELGIPGAVLVTYLNYALLVRCLIATRRMENKRLRWFAVCVVLYGIAESATWLAGPTLQGTLAAFFWFLCGAVLKLEWLERRAKEPLLRAGPTVGPGQALPGQGRA